jgi:hypothetical protein
VEQVEVLGVKPIGGVKTCMKKATSSLNQVKRGHTSIDVRSKHSEPRFFSVKFM